MTNFEGEEKLEACHVEQYFSLSKQHYLHDRVKQDGLALLRAEGTRNIFTVSKLFPEGMDIQNIIP